MSYSNLEIFLGAILLIFLLILICIATKVIISNIETFLKFLLIALLIFVPVVGVIINVIVLMKKDDFSA